MKVTVYGPGCARCVKNRRNRPRRAEAEGIPVQLEKVSDYAAIAAAGVLATPGVTLDGKIVSTGKIPTVPGEGLVEISCAPSYRRRSGGWA